MSDIFEEPDGGTDLSEEEKEGLIRFMNPMKTKPISITVLHQN